MASAESRWVAERDALERPDGGSVKPPQHVRDHEIARRQHDVDRVATRLQIAKQIVDDGARPCGLYVLERVEEHGRAARVRSKKFSQPCAIVWNPDLVRERRPRSSGGNSALRKIQHRTVGDELRVHLA